MALKLKNSIFFHFPKTGGTFVRSACKAMGAAHGEIGPAHSWPALTPSLNLPSFCFVRHPVDWYRSFWAFSQRTVWHWHPLFAPLDHCRSDSFCTFVEKVLVNTPGLYSARIYHFAEYCDLVGHTESLREDLISILTAYGETVYEEFVRTKAISLPSHPTATISRKLGEDLMAAEQYVTDKWGYNQLPDWVAE